MERWRKGKRKNIITDIDEIVPKDHGFVYN